MVATAVLRDDLYLHLSPGREYGTLSAAAGQRQGATAGARVGAESPARRASPARRSPVPPGAADVRHAAGERHPALLRSCDPTPATPPKPTATSTPVPGQPEPPPPILEDWWLVRDGSGHAGWLLFNRMDVDVPDSVAQYAEGQRIVGAYVLTRITDPTPIRPTTRCRNT